MNLKIYRGKSLMNVHTEHNIIHAENVMAHLRGEDDIRTLQKKSLNKQQLVTGAHDFIFKLPYNRYSYCEHNAVSFLCSRLSVLKIQLDI